MDVEVKLCDLGQVNPHAVVNVHSPGLPSPGDDGIWLILWGFPGSHGVIFFTALLLTVRLRQVSFVALGHGFLGPSVTGGELD